eukprot:gene3772-4123_t
MATSFKQICFASTIPSDVSNTLTLPSSAPLLANNEQPNSKEWDLKGLKKEVNRQQMRAFKKVSKVSERLAREEKAFALLATSDSEVKNETCPDPISVKQELESASQRLKAIQALEDSLAGIQSSRDPRFQVLLPVIAELNITDSAPPPPERGPKKVKNVAGGPRLPYFTFQSADGIDIRVGRTASDNDDLSCNKELRDDYDWWMHVAGHAGSHVVIRYTGDDLLTSYKQTVIDAALLAAVNSKGNQGGKVAVSLTRCRNVSKPRGAKPGLVHLNGEITPVKVDIKAEAARLERLQATKK